MMELCKNLHAFLRFSEDAKQANVGGDDGGGGAGGGGDCGRPPLPCQHLRTKDTFLCSSGLSVVAEEVHKPRNVLESFAIKAPVPPTRRISAASRPVFAAKGCHDEEGSGMHNCTEGLGFESSDESEPAEPETASADGRGEIADGKGQAYLEKRLRRKMASRMRSKAELPPPLPWLSAEGRPSFFLRQERRDGRTLLTEMRAGPRREMFVADRRDGRLTLQLVGKPQPRKEEEEKEEKKEAEISEGGEYEEKEGDGGRGSGEREACVGGENEGCRLLAKLGGSWRCCDDGRGEHDGFWNQQYVMST